MPDDTSAIAAYWKRRKEVVEADQQFVHAAAEKYKGSQPTLPIAQTKKETYVKHFAEEGKLITALKKFYEDKLAEANQLNEIDSLIDTVTVGNGKASTQPHAVPSSTRPN